MKGSLRCMKPGEGSHAIEIMAEFREELGCLIHC